MFCLCINAQQLVEQRDLRGVLFLLKIEDKQSEGVVLTLVVLLVCDKACQMTENTTGRPLTCAWRKEPFARVA